MKLTVESSLFMEDQYALLSWVALAQDFTFQRTYTQAYV